MRSFEIMDTLFTRYCKVEDLFGYIEENYPYPEFKEQRIQAEKVAREKHKQVTLDLIYDALKENSLENTTLASFEELKDYEFSLEVENSIPIHSILNSIEPDDIFINNTYFNREQLKILFNKHGILERTVVHSIESDPYLESKVKTNLSEFTKTETLLYTSPLLKKIRSFRLKNPSLEKDVLYKEYDDQACYGLPILLLFCIHLKKIIVKENRNKVLFCTKGLYEMFTVMYPEMECVLFSTSYLIHIHPTSSYKEYVQKTYQDKCILVDLYGFFREEGYVYKDIFGCIPRVHVLLHNLQYDFPSLSSCIESSQLSTEYIETLSYESRGVLFSMIECLELRLHEKTKKPSLEILRSFSEQFVNLEPVEIDIHPILLDIIDTCSR